MYNVSWYIYSWCTLLGYKKSFFASLKFSWRWGIWNNPPSQSGNKQKMIKGNILFRVTQNKGCHSLSAPDVLHCQMPAVSEHRCLGDPNQDSCVKASNKSVRPPWENFFFHVAEFNFYSQFPKFCIQIFIAAWCNGAINCIHLECAVINYHIPLNFSTMKFCF